MEREPDAIRDDRIYFIGLLLLCCFIHTQIQANGSPIPSSLRSRTYNEHIYILMYSGTAKGVFALVMMFLGLGGMRREQRYRTATFTLALPVSRLDLAVTQIVVGLSEMAILSLIPSFLIPLLSRLVHEAYPFTEALHFSFLWFSCGSVILAAAFLLSVVLGGEYTAPGACYVALMLELSISMWPPLRPYRLNLMWTMGEFGTMHWDSHHRFLLSDPLPWARLLIIMLIAFGMFTLAARITQKQDY